VKGYDFQVDSRGLNPNQLFYAEGTYTVSYSGLTGSFEVKEPKSSFWDKIPGFTYESIMLGLISTIIILWYARVRKS
jgi:hypothetical protein